MKPLTATFAAAFLALTSLVSAGSAEANEWKMEPLSSQVSISPEALGLHNTDRRNFLCMALAIYHEARGENLLGKRAVAHVVYNRTNSRAFPETICGVVWQKGQFGWAPRPVGSLIPRDSNAWLEAQRIALQVIQHPERDPTGGATYFYGTKERKPQWAAKATRSWQHGGHIFVHLPSGKRTTTVLAAKVVETVTSTISIAEPLTAIAVSVQVP